MNRELVSGEAAPRCELGHALLARVGIRHHVQAFHVPLHVLARGTGLGANAASPELVALGAVLWIRIRKDSNLLAGSGSERILMNIYSIEYFFCF